MTIFPPKWVGETNFLCVQNPCIINGRPYGNLTVHSRHYVSYSLLTFCTSNICRENNFLDLLRTNTMHKSINQRNLHSRMREKEREREYKQEAWLKIQERQGWFQKAGNSPTFLSQFLEAPSSADQQEPSCLRYVTIQTEQGPHITQIRYQVQS